MSVIQRGTLVMKDGNLAIVGRDYGHCVSFYTKYAKKVDYTKPELLTIISDKHADVHASDKYLLDTLFSL